MLFPNRFVHTCPLRQSPPPKSTHTGGKVGFYRFHRHLVGPIVGIHARPCIYLSCTDYCILPKSCVYGIWHSGNAFGQSPVPCRHTNRKWKSGFNGSFGWADSDGFEGNKPSGFVDRAAVGLASGRPIALGFECPLFVPLSETEDQLGKDRFGEGSGAWSAGASCGALASGLVQAYMDSC